MFHLFLKPFLGFVTVGGLGTGVYFLYKHSESKTSTSKTSEVEGKGSETTEGTVSSEPAVQGLKGEKTELQEGTKLETR